MELLEKIFRRKQKTSKLKKAVWVILFLLLLIVIILGVFFWWQQSVQAPAGEPTSQVEEAADKEDVNSVIIEDISSGKFYKFDDLFTIRVELGQILSYGVRLKCRIINLDEEDHRDISLRFRAEIEKDGEQTIETQTVSLPELESKDNATMNVLLTEARAAEDIGEIEVIAEVGE